MRTRRYIVALVLMVIYSLSMGHAMYHHQLHAMLSGDHSHGVCLCQENGACPCSQESHHTHNDNCNHEAQRCHDISSQTSCACIDHMPDSQHRCNADNEFIHSENKLRLSVPQVDILPALVCAVLQMGNLQNSYKTELDTEPQIPIYSILVESDSPLRAPPTIS